MRDLKWLITGGCGFIGSNLVHHLVNDEGDYSIRILDNLSTGTRSNLDSVTNYEETTPEACGSMVRGKVELLKGDIRDRQLALRTAKGADIIVHLAANASVPESVERPHYDCAINVTGTLNFLEAARRQDVSRFVFASSVAPIGDCNPPIHEDIPPHPKAPYGASKLAGEGYCSAYHESYGVETVALRFGNVYGPGSSHKSSVIAKFIRRALEGKVLEVHGSGQQTRDFIYIEDLVRAIIASAIRPDVGGELFQIATGRETSISELVDMLVPIVSEVNGSEPIDTKKTDPREGDIQHSYADISKAEEKLNWNPRIALEEGLKRTIRNFMQPSFLDGN